MLKITQYISPPDCEMHFSEQKKTTHTHKKAIDYKGQGLIKLDIYVCSVHLIPPKLSKTRSPLQDLYST